VVDLVAEQLERIEERPVFPNMEPATLKRLFEEPLPETGMSSDSVLDELERKLLPCCTHLGHPGHFGLTTPSPNLMGVLGDFICSALNQNIGIYCPCSRTDAHRLRWPPKSSEEAATMRRCGLACFAEWRRSRGA